MGKLPLLALVALLAACGDPDPLAAQAEDAPATVPAAPSGAPADRPTPPSNVSVALDAEGLRFVTGDTGTTSLLAFGAEREQVEQAVAKATGQSPTRSVGEECPAGPTQFTRFGELQLAFQEDRWIGWALNGADPHTTIDGVGIGTTRAEAEASRLVTTVPDSTLGEEFILGSAEQETAIGGVFREPGPGGRIEYLWAGTACNFR